MLWGISAARGLPLAQTARAFGPNRATDCAAIEASIGKPPAARLRAVSEAACLALIIKRCCLTFKRPRSKKRARITQGDITQETCSSRRHAENIAPPESSTATDLQSLRSVRDASGKSWRRWSICRLYHRISVGPKGAKGMPACRATANATRDSGPLPLGCRRALSRSLDGNSDGSFRRKSCRPASIVSTYRSTVEFAWRPRSTANGA